MEYAAFAMALGTYPTPVRKVEALWTDHARLWLKDDGVTNPRYGGNKVRKLEHLLPAAVHRKAKRIVTMGAAGSHHALATALFAKDYGLPTVAVLCPQPKTPHVLQMLTATASAADRVVPTRSMLTLPLAVARELRRGDYLIPAGGSSPVGTRGYISAVDELLKQVADKALPLPDVVVTPVGSGGTAVGLALGFAARRVPVRVLGVRVVPRWIANQHSMAPLMLRAGGVRALGPTRQVLEIVGGYEGDGYGHPSSLGQAATRVAASVGLRLDPTYTAKAFAKVLDLLRLPVDSQLGCGQTGRPRHVLYWHTLSAASPTPTSVDLSPLPDHLGQLLT